MSQGIRSFLCVLLFVACLGNSWRRTSAGAPAAPPVKPGDLVVTTAPAKVMRGEEVVESLDPQTVLSVTSVKGSWIGVNYYGKIDGSLGWIQRQYLISMEAAIADQSAQLQRRPADLRVLFRRGQSYAFTGDFDRAIADFDQILKIEPEHTLTQESRDEALLLQSVKVKCVRQIRADAQAKRISAGLKLQMERLYSWDSTARLEAIQDLNAMGSRAAAALPCLLPLREDWSQGHSEPQVVNESNAAELGIRDPQLMGAVVRRGTTLAFAAKLAISTIGEGATESLIEKLADEDPVVRKDAVCILQEVLGTSGEDLGEDPAKWRGCWDQWREHQRRKESPPGEQRRFLVSPRKGGLVIERPPNE